MLSICLTRVHLYLISTSFMLRPVQPSEINFFSHREVRPFDCLNFNDFFRQNLPLYMWHCYGRHYIKLLLIDLNKWRYITPRCDIMWYNVYPFLLTIWWDHGTICLKYIYMYILTFQLGVELWPLDCCDWLAVSCRIPVLSQCSAWQYNLHQSVMWLQSSIASVSVGQSPGPQWIRSLCTAWLGIFHSNLIGRLLDWKIKITNSLILFIE